MNFISNNYERFTMNQSSNINRSSPLKKQITFNLELSIKYSKNFWNKLHHIHTLFINGEVTYTPCLSTKWCCSGGYTLITGFSWGNHGRSNILMLIVRLYGEWQPIFHIFISAILECEFRRDSIRHCFRCWRLVRPLGNPATEESLLLRGKRPAHPPQVQGPRP